ncbi:hypothetical protein BDA99DRAFT_245217 [Phascolomyces articulosus]|uniref:Uncharacterized protein n=1 Tax=Phascolomyces articulosus TaxID=60185 RepID=A0AAD5K946_9FUNG|nr:hypothetical protein BDA99DRAFT_245217 [Phascolomyces articulosus]
MHEKAEAEAANNNNNNKKDGEHDEKDWQSLYEKRTKELEELQHRLDRQLEAFNTIRGELTTVRDRQLENESRLEREKRELETTLQRLQAEYKGHLDQLWNQHQNAQETLETRRTALDEAQVKLMMNGLSPVSENEFEWPSDEEQAQEEVRERRLQHQQEHHHQQPTVGKLPPLEKPAFFQFLETPRCSGCQSEVIDI